VPAEPITQALVDAARAIGIHDMIVIGPWIPSPWDVVRCTDPGDDINLLATKLKAMTRFAEGVIAKIV
jgi:hypothetical protein